MRIATLALAGLIAAAAGPMPAQAQGATMNVCVVNASGAVLRSSIMYRWQQANGTTAQGNTPQVQIVLGNQHCEAIPYQDLMIETTVQLQAWNGGWSAFCGGGGQTSISLPVPTRGGTVVASGTLFSPQCAVNQ